MAGRRKNTALPAPYLQRIILLEERMGTRSSYPMNLPWADPDLFELRFEQPVTIVTGENGSGKSTLIEGIAALSGYGDLGGGKGYPSLNGSGGKERKGADLGEAMRGSWLPKVTKGWFFRAESFFNVARYLDEVGSPMADYLSQSHGEGFVSLFEDRMSGQGIYFLDEPESALSPNRQKELLCLLARIQRQANAQVIMATHSPILMAVPGAQVLEATRDGFDEIDYRESAHFRLYREFIQDPQGFVNEALEQGEEDDYA